jgi:hypothetical protein
MTYRAEDRVEAQVNAQRVSIRVNLSKRKVVAMYKLIPPPMSGIEPGSVLEGKVHDISSDGISLEGELPDPSYVLRLGQGDFLIGVNILADCGMIKALGQVRWVDVLKPGKYKIGLQFIKLEQQHKATLEKFLIRNQLHKMTGRYSRP